MRPADGWPKLCAFLGKPIPETPYPHSNKRWGFFITTRLVLPAMFVGGPAPVMTSRDRDGIASDLDHSIGTAILACRSDGLPHLATPAGVGPSAFIIPFSRASGSM